MAEQFSTYGEAMFGRALEQEKRAGVEHYVSGQESITIEFVTEDGVEIGILALHDHVDAMGRAVRVSFGRAPTGEWFPVLATTAGLFIPPRNSEPPTCFSPKGEILEKLERALAEARS